jgi:hypothetical protein
MDSSIVKPRMVDTKAVPYYNLPALRGTVVRARKLLVLLLAAWGVAAGCRPEKPPMKTYRIGEQGLQEGKQVQEEKLSGVELATVGGRPITAMEVVDFLRELPAFQRYYYSSPEKILLFVQNYVVMMGLAGDAVAAGLANAPYVRATLEKALALKYQQEFLSNAVKPSDIPKHEVDAYLASHPGLAAPDADAAGQAVAAILSQRREDAWRRHLEALRTVYGIPAVGGP